MNTFTDILKERTKKDLTSLAKLHHLSGYSSLHKQELAETLGEYLLLPEIMYPYFVYLGEDELNTFFNFNSSSDSFLLKRFMEGGYCFKRKDGTIIIPEEIQKESFLTDSFWKEQKRKSFFVDCLNTIGYLYGCAPISIFLKLYNNNHTFSLTKEQFLKEFSQLPTYHNYFILENDLIIHCSLYENKLYQKIQKCQGILPFYIPTQKEILHLSRFGTFPEDACSRRVVSCLTRILITEIQTAEQISREIQAIFRQGGSIHDAITYLTDHCGLSSSLTGDKQLLSSLNEMFAHTRLLLNRGNTASEVIRIRQKKIKIYPNNPCPCGSGKKYKNCCGKR